MAGYLENDLHMQTLAMDADTPADLAWYAWCNKAEKLAGHDMDGNERRGAGYSMDGAYDAWKAGQTPAQYVNGIAGRRGEYHRNPELYRAKLDGLKVEER